MKNNILIFIKDEKMKEKKPLGVILYRGPSMLDGKNIIVAATNVFGNKTTNEKIGDMIPIWIIKSDIAPSMSVTEHARKSVGYSDSTVCGNCKHRDLNTCYVTLFHGPDQVYGAYHRDRYVTYDKSESMKDLFRDKKVRIGAYGDPAAVPMYIWDEICGLAKTHTGYTHQWNNKKISLNYLDNLKKYCMASCDTVSEQQEASKLGWRTFRIRLPKTDKVLKSKNLTKQTVILDDEFVCPASKEAGKITDCAHCGGCSGTNSNYVKNVCIIIHGADFKKDKFIDGIKKILNKKSWKLKIQKPKKKKRWKKLVKLAV
jgi:hypothetical protein